MIRPVEILSRLEAIGVRVVPGKMGVVLIGFTDRIPPDLLSAVHQSEEELYIEVACREMADSQEI